MTRALRATTLSAVLMLAASAPARASGGGEGEGGLFYPALNLLLLLAVLVYFARKPIQEFFAERRTGVQESLESAAALRDEAEARYAEWQRRLTDLDAELAEIRTRARERAEAEREKILRDAQASARRIREDAHTAVEHEIERARRALREEAADLAIELAGERLRAQVEDADRSRLLDEFIGRVESREDS